MINRNSSFLTFVPPGNVTLQLFPPRREVSFLTPRFQAGLVTKRLSEPQQSGIVPVQGVLLDHQLLPRARAWANPPENEKCMAWSFPFQTRQQPDGHSTSEQGHPRSTGLQTTPSGHRATR